MSSLFRDSPADFQRRIDRLVEHFRHAESVWFVRNDGKKGLPTPRDLLWILICDAVNTSRIIPDKERRMVSKMPSALPQSRVTPDQAYSVELSRLLDNDELARRGLPARHEPKVRETVHESDIDRMVDVMDLFRFVVGGRNGKDVLRMKRTVIARAYGLTLEQCGRVYDKHRLDFDRRAMHDLKSRVVGQMLAGIEKEFGLVRTSRSFRRLTVREIERRKKMRQREEQSRREEEANA